MFSINKSKWLLLLWLILNAAALADQLPKNNLTLIHQIQGDSVISPLLGSIVTVEAIVVGDFQGRSALTGFFVQEQDTEVDKLSATSEGLFVYDPNGRTDVHLGDLVRVTGLVKEYYGLTELTQVNVTVVSGNHPLPSAANLSLPLASRDALEPYEGMRVSLPQPLTVTDNYQLGRYGEVWLSFGGRLMAPTQVAFPGEDAKAVSAANALNRILINDGRLVQNPEPIIHPAPQLTASNSLRCGDRVTGVTGVLSYAYGHYRVEPTSTLPATHQRTGLPSEVGGRLKVAAFNVLNYFNGNGMGGGFPTSRGADSLVEFQRQREKLIFALTAMAADIIGLVELENDGYSGTSAIQDLVNGLNAAAPSGIHYAFINPGVFRMGTDAITVGLIYRVETVMPVQPAAVLDSSVDSRYHHKNRPTLAQTFQERATGSRLTVAVTHLKSKGSNCNRLGDPNVGDGQGNCNLTRTRAAQALVDWLATEANVLIIGDLNAYANEDPITVLKKGGYIDLIDELLEDSRSYSYIYQGQAGYLDYALASSSLWSQVTGVTVWAINADEPRVLDYNMEYQSAGQQGQLYHVDPYRSSDHDPVIVGLSLNAIVSD